MKPTNRAAEAWRITREAMDLVEEGRIHEAMAAYARAAHMGDVVAQSNLGNLLDDTVTPSRPKEAVYWYKRASRAGYAPAAWNLAMHYRNLGRPRWHIHWLRVAARLGEEYAPEALREMIRPIRAPNTAGAG
jgi:TPR repeat protein